MVSKTMAPELTEKLARERNMNVVSMVKHYSTWYWFVTNPLGGGFGSNDATSKKVALAKALRGVKASESYTLITNGKENGIFVKVSDEEKARFEVAAKAAVPGSAGAYIYRSLAAGRRI